MNRFYFVNESICTTGPGGRNDNQVSESFFSLIIDEATGNPMTSLKTFIPNFFDAMWARSDKEMCLGFPTTPAVTAKNWKSWSRMHQLVMCLAYAVHNDDANAVFREWRAYLSSPAGAPGRNSSQATMGASQNPLGIEPADLQRRFPKTYLECIVIPNSRWLNRIGFEDLIELSKKFRFLVGSCPGWEAAFSDVIRFQCNCPVFWSRFACEHALLLGLHLKIDDAGWNSGCAGTVPPCPFAASTVSSINLFGQVSLLLTISTCRTIICDDEEDGLRKRQRLKSGPRQEAQFVPHD